MILWQCTSKHSGCDKFKINIKSEKKKFKYEFPKNQTRLKEIVHVSYIVSEKVVKHSKSYSIGKFKKECILPLAKILFHEKLGTFDLIRFYRKSITRIV